MTQRKALLRKRRPASSVLRISDELRAHFEGTAPDSWEAILDDPETLLAKWALWLEDHPGARPPAGYEYLDERGARTKERK